MSLISCDVDVIASHPAPAENVKVSWMRSVSAGLCLILWSLGPVPAAPGASGSPAAPAPLFHGNWCGAGDMNRASPVDALDAACRAHDLCYERVGRGACICD